MLIHMLMCVYRKRVFILGPSHHVYLAGCALSSLTHYKTPLYDLEIDQKSEVCKYVYILATV